MQKILIRMMSEEGHRFLCIRKTKESIRNSIFKGFVDLIGQMGLEEDYKCNISTMEITYLPNGSSIIMSGVDDPEKLKSIFGITGVFIEEATELDEEDFNQLILRVRGIPKYYQQFILCLNPIDKSHWIKRRFFDRQTDEIDTYITTYKDNPFVGAEYVKVMEEMRISDPVYYSVYALAQWGERYAGGNFYKGFTYAKNVGILRYNPGIPLHISFDFNKNPHCTLTIWQVVGKEARCIDELYTDSPKNETKELSRIFTEKYINHEQALYVYGDPAGRHQDTRSENGWNDFKIIEKELEYFRPQMRVSKKAPGVGARQQFINNLFQGYIEGYSCVVSDNCPRTIEDVSNIKEATDQKGNIIKYKEKWKYPKTGIVCEKYGHFSDTVDYFLCEIFKTAFLNYKTGGKPVQMRLGPRYRNEKNRY